MAGPAPLHFPPWAAASSSSASLARDARRATSRPPLGAAWNVYYGPPPRAWMRSDVLPTNADADAHEAAYAAACLPPVTASHGNNGRAAGSPTASGLDLLALVSDLGDDGLLEPVPDWAAVPLHAPAGISTTVASPPRLAPHLQNFHYGLLTPASTPNDPPTVCIYSSSSFPVHDAAIVATLAVPVPAAGGGAGQTACNPAPHDPASFLYLPADQLVPADHHHHHHHHQWTPVQSPVPSSRWIGEYHHVAPADLDAHGREYSDAYTNRPLSVPPTTTTPRRHVPRLEEQALHEFALSPAVLCSASPQPLPPTALATPSSTASPTGFESPPRVAWPHLAPAAPLALPLPPPPRPRPRPVPARAPLPRFASPTPLDLLARTATMLPPVLPPWVSRMAAPPPQPCAPAPVPLEPTVPASSRYFGPPIPPKFFATLARPAAATPPPPPPPHSTPPLPEIEPSPHPPKTYECTHCDKTFARKFNLVSHMQRHTTVKPYKCAHCDRAFARKHDCVRHERTHKRA
ncbi:hypothetical protein H9P43_001784 [Blastocladiella emersonii ATCC 22665]|nr:hypothetical protein H9P43_001784 [Blastocladiella emersonii ATCC 22665]